MDDVGERLADFLYGFTTTETFTGFKKVTLITIGTGSGSIPTGTGVQTAINVEGRTIGGDVELITIDADGNEIQLTSKGNRLPNDTWFKVTDAAGTGGVNIFKVNTGGAVECPSILAAVYPVGCIYTSTVATDPATLFGFGTWVAFGEGRVLVGKAGSGTFATADGTGGAETHTLTSGEMPAHTHPVLGGSEAYVGNYVSVGSSVNDKNGVTGSTGSGGAHNNLQPFVVVYFFKRTA
jgi:hypothetical protein